MRYTDPTGMFSIDEENHTITCDYNDEKDVKAAYKAFKKNETLEKCIIKDFNMDCSLVVKDRDAMGRIVASKVLSKYTISDFESCFADCITVGQIYMPKDHFFSTSGNIIGSVSVLFDLRDIKDAIETKDDLALFLGLCHLATDVIGFIGPEGACISFSLKYTVKYSIEFAFLMAEYELQTRKKAVSSWIYSLHDPWGYYFEEN